MSRHLAIKVALNQKAGQPMKQCVVLLVFALSLNALSFAQAPKSRETGLTASVELSQKIDTIFAPLDSPTSPGAAVILVKEGAVFYERGYGSANLEYGIRITPATVFDIASVSKQFTGFAIAMLIERVFKKLVLREPHQVPSGHGTAQTVPNRPQ
jgi:CubicO group peptidase (beta-lactamase class C family)